ncbi:hypothetical protein OFM21_28415, partial [Escherichia coli]|nr:hypothetical protein [Escherichia coli]
RRVVARLCKIQPGFNVSLIRRELLPRVVGARRIFLVCVSAGKPGIKLLAKRQKVAARFDLSA